MSIEPPPTRYARSGDVHIAYQVAGEGDLDLLLVPGFVSNVEEAWNSFTAAFYERLAASFRLILFDKRGTGLSDPLPPGQVPALEDRMDDLRAVLDAAGSHRAAIMGVSEGGALACLFAASAPERVSALVLVASTARMAHAPDAPWGWPPELVADAKANMLDSWGTGRTLAMLTPDLLGEPGFLDAAGRFERRAASPAMAAAVVDLAAATDVRAVLPAVTAPTLVVHHVGDPIISVQAGRDLARRIEGAELVELPGSDHAPYFSFDPILDEVERFLLGGHQPVEPDRVLATVLFTDIVQSTERVAAAGDASWRHTLDRYEAMVGRQLGRFNGRKVKFTGDGTLATFDGPARAVRCAAAIAEGARNLGVETRAGVHTGECEVRGDDVAGIAVHVASRVMAAAGASEVLVSRTVTDLVAGSGLAFESRGAHELKGVPGEWQLFAVAAAG